MNKKYWVCIIGPVDPSELPDGADAPPRSAALDAVIRMTDRQPECWSGWGTDENRFNAIMDAWTSDAPDANDPSPEVDILQRTEGE